MKTTVSETHVLHRRYTSHTGPGMTDPQTEKDDCLSTVLTIGNDPVKK